jgi:hypothetical protein
MKNIVKVYINERSIRENQETKTQFEGNQH